MLFCDSKSCFGFKISQYHHLRTFCREVNGVFSARKCSFMVVAEPPAALWWQAVSRQHPPWYASLPSSAELNSFPCRREQVMLSGNRADSMNLFTRLGTSHFCFVCLQQPANCTRGAEKAEAAAEQYAAGSLKKGGTAPAVLRNTLLMLPSPPPQPPRLPSQFTCDISSPLGQFLGPRNHLVMLIFPVPLLYPPPVLPPP